MRIQIARANPARAREEMHLGPHPLLGLLQVALDAPHRYFTCDSYGRTDEASGDILLNQNFRFNDGKTQWLKWCLHQCGSVSWEATARDMIKAVETRRDNNVLWWDFALPPDSHEPSAAMDIRQWICRPPGADHLIPRLTFNQMGSTISEVSETVYEADTRTPGPAPVERPRMSLQHIYQ